MLRKLVAFSATIAVWVSAGSCGGYGGSGGGYSNGGGGGTTYSERDAIYVLTGASSGEVVTLVFDSTSGTLSAGSSLQGPPGGLDLTVDPAAKFLYAKDFDSNSIYGYSYDGKTGALTALSGLPF